MRAGRAAALVVFYRSSALSYVLRATCLCMRPPLSGDPHQVPFRSHTFAGSMLLQGGHKRSHVSRYTHPSEGACQVWSSVSKELA